MCATLEVSRSAFYAWERAESTGPQDADNKLKVHIRAIHRRSRRTYGSPRVHAELVAEGLTVGVHKVARLMRDMGLRGVPHRKRSVRTTVSDDTASFAENILNRDFTADAPNQAWVADITYLPPQAGWAYLAVIIDLSIARRPAESGGLVRG
jgi:putative transposase